MHGLTIEWEYVLPLLNLLYFKVTCFMKLQDTHVWLKWVWKPKLNNPTWMISQEVNALNQINNYNFVLFCFAAFADFLLFYPFAVILLILKMVGINANTFDQRIAAIKRQIRLRAHKSVYERYTPHQRWVHYLVNKSQYVNDPEHFRNKFVHYRRWNDRYASIYKILKKNFLKNNKFLNKYKYDIFLIKNKLIRDNYKSLNNKYSPLHVEEDEYEYSYPREDYDDTPIKLNKLFKRNLKKNKSFRKSDECQAGDHRFSEHSYKVRRALKSVRYIGSISRPEGKEDAHSVDPGAQQVIEDTAGNVCLQRQTAESSAKIISSKIPTNIGAGDHDHNYADLVGRWIKLSTYEWTSNDPVSHPLISMPLPLALNTYAKKTPNYLPFKIFQYVHFDSMTVKIQINSNKTQIGQLQASWLYSLLEDAHSTLRGNVYTLSQAPHVLINAGSSNSAELEIGYRNPLPYLPIRQNSVNKNQDILNLGFLQIRVLNPLLTTSATQNKCSITVFLKLNNAEFIGMVGEDVSVSQPEMMAGLTMLAAERVLDTILPDPNRDKPPAPGAKPPMVPQSVQSLACGTNIAHPLNPLRLNAMAQTPHPQLVTDEMSVVNIATKYGLVKSITLSADDGTKNIAGALIASFDASPMWSADQYYKGKYNGTDVYYVPPVGVVSSMFAQWRGCLSMRCDIVASFMHCLRILVVYVPRQLTNITIDQARSSPHMVYDLQEQQSFVFTIPYITNKYAWPRRVGFSKEINDVDPPGKVHMFVLNPLVTNSSIPKEIYFNIYWAAADDFEVMIPAQPVVQLPYWITNNPADKVAADVGYFPWYWGHWENLYGDKKVIARYGPVLNHIAQFYNMDPNTYMVVDTADTSNIPQYKGTDGKFYAPKYFVTVDVGDGYGAVYMSIVATLEKAKQYIDKNDKKNYHNLDLLENVANDDAGQYCTGNPKFVKNTTEDFMLVDPEMMRAVSFDERDERQNVCQVLPCAKRNIAKEIYGETFDSLKDLCRRYQPYAYMEDKQGSNTIADAKFRIPLLPQGLDLNITGNSGKYSKYIRDGVIPLIASGFRYYRGGLDFTLFMRLKDDSVLWVQHRPDDYTAQLNTTIITNTTGVASYMNVGYALHVQANDTNSMFTFQVPYYQPLAYSLLQRPKIQSPTLDYVINQTLNGCLYIGYESSKADSKMTASLLYALSDDAHFEVFQGFPPVTLDKYVSCEGFSDIIKTAAKASTSGIQVQHNIPEIPTSIDVNVSHTMNLSPEQHDTIANKLKELTGSIVDFGATLIGHIGHIIINPTKKGIAWALGHILLKIGILKDSLIDLFMNAVTSVMSYFGITRFAKPQQRSEEGTEMNILTSSPEMDDDTLISFVDVGFTVVSQLAGLALTPPKDKQSFIKLIKQDISNCLRTGNFFFTFLRNNIAFFKKIAQYATCFWNRDQLLTKMLDQELPTLIDWCNEVDMLLDPMHENKVFSLDSSLADRIEEAYFIGTQINAMFIDHTEKYPKSREAFQAFNSLFRRLREHRAIMHKRGRGAVSRREPFCMWFVGDPGVGKSQLMQYLVPHLLAAESIETDGDLIFTLPSHAKWWNGCRSQPAIMFDDFLNVQGDACLDSVSFFWSIKSPAVLNPPLAHLDDKELRYAPELFMVGCNYAYPVIQNVCKEAMFRRREMLIQVELKPEVAAEMNKITDEKAFKDLCIKLNIDATKFEHLRIRIYRDPSDATSTLGEYISVQELLDMAKRRFKSYRKAQYDLYDMRLKQYEAIMKQVHVGETLTQRSDRYKRLIEFIKITSPQEHCSFSQYMKLAEQYAANQCMSTANIRTLMGMDVEIRERFKAKCEGKGDRLYPGLVGTFGGGVEGVENIRKHFVKSLDIAAYAQCKHVDMSITVVYNKDKNIFEDPILGRSYPGDVCGEYCMWLEPELRRRFIKDYIRDLKSSGAYFPEDLPAWITNTTTTPTTVFRSKLMIYWDAIKAACSDFYDKYINPALKLFWKFLKYASPFIALLGAFYGVSAYITKDTGIAAEATASLASCGMVGGAIAYGANAMNDTMAGPELQPSGDMRDIKASLSSAKPSIAVFARPNASVGQHIDEVITLIYRNTFFIQGYNAMTTGSKNRVLFICEDYALLFNHYFMNWKLNFMERVKLTHPSRSDMFLDIAIADLTINKMDDSDLVLVKFPGFTMQRNIVHFIANVKEHTKPRMTCTMIEITPHMTKQYYLPIENNASTVVRMYDDTILRVKDLYTYAWHGEGRCCSVILDPNLNSPILGLHCAGSAGQGFANMIIRESFINYEKPSRISSTHPGVIDSPIFTDKLRGAYIPVGITDTGLSHHQASTTKIVPSLVHDKIFKHVSEPAPLAQGDKRVEWDPGHESPLYVGVENLMKPLKNFSEKILDKMEGAMQERFVRTCTPTRKLSVLTYQEAIFGIPGEPYYEAINMQTSEGYPFSRYRPAGASDKSWLFQWREEGSQRIITGMHPILMRQLSAKLEKRMNGEPVSVIYDDCLKDSRLPFNKISVPGKTRIFSTSPVDYTIQFKQYFGDLLAAYAANRHQMHHMIGVAPDGPEWGLLARRLRAVSDVIVTGDYKNFGPSVSRQIAQRVAKMWLNWYKVHWKHQYGVDPPKEDTNVREQLMNELIYNHHCVFNIIWLAVSGIPSGSPATAQFNTDVNWWYIAYFFLVIVKLPMHVFFSDICMIGYGDDYIMAVAARFMDIFNNITISTRMAEYGLIMTSADKSSNVPYTIGFKNSTFLKRGFVKHPKFAQEFLAPLDEEYSVKEVINWIHVSNDAKGATEESIIAANNQAYSLGPDRFLQIHKQLNHALLLIQSTKILKSWEELDAMFFPSYYTK